MEEKKLVPKLRFPGFTEPWEQRKFRSLFQKNLERNDGQFPFNKTISISRMIYSESGNGASTESLDNYKVLRVGDIAFEGHENKDFKFGRFVMNDVGNGIMSPRFTVLRPLIDMELNFWKEYINYEPIMQKKLVYSTKKGTMMNELVVEDFLNQYVAVPSVQEQQKIGYLLKCMTDDITLHQRKLEHLKLKKKSLLQKLFPKEGSVYPELRFPGFTDPWEQRKLGELYKPRREKNDGRFGKDKIISVANMYFKNDVKLATSEYLLTYNVFLLGDIAFEGHCNNSFSYGRFVENSIGDGIVSHVFDVLMPNTKCCINYWKVFINYEPIMGKILRRCTNSSRMMANLELKAFLKETINIPTIKEQQKIGNFLEQFDQYITLHQRKLEHLQLLKKALLQQLFV